MGDDKKKKQKTKTNSSKNSGAREEIKTINDDRFASAQSDPRFMEAPKRRYKVEIDSRFSRVFTDTSFTSSNAPVDKRGKSRKNKGNATASLSHYYRLRRKEDENERSLIDEKEHEDIRAESDQIGHETETESEKSIESLEDDDDGQSFDEYSSTSTAESDPEDRFMDEEEEEDAFMQQEDNVPEIDTETQRLAVVNLDWSQVRAVDLYVLLSSLLPKGGQILSVAVYPSEFGLKRMEEEAVRGPVGLFDEEHDDGEDDDIDNKKLRAYELSRLRYYYAVVECDSSATADYLYRTCDGVEFERSANKLDLRFIPDSMDFKHQPRDVATEAPTEYEGLDFHTRALQASNIHLTWDEDEPQRAKTLKRKLTDEQVKMLAELELKEILASDESETDDEGNGTEDLSVKKCKKRDKYRALIQSGDGSESDEGDNDQDMEVTFSSGLEDLSKRILEKDKKSETVWEAYLRKRKEKKKASKKGYKYSSEDISSESDRELCEQPDDFFVEEPPDTGNKGQPVRSTKKRTDWEINQEAEASRAELELLAADDVGANLKGYNLKPKSKGKKGKVIQDEGKIPTIDYEDPRFSALFTSPHFALDPTDPQFKRSAAYARQKIDDKRNIEQMERSEIPGEASTHKGENIAPDRLPRTKEKNELSSLVRSIKLKSNKVPLPSKLKVSRKYNNLIRK
ncbi:hypothetical protein OROHE_014516 [Orobanche hederae]